ncbi:MAG: hypothetical protein QOG87_72 [Actinomycetota bacterium]|jgi:uncharacterized protein (TIGR03083 family)
MDIWGEVDGEREDNIAMLEGLTPEQWDVPSLCGGWRVRDVAAHLSSPAATPQPLRMVGLFAKSGFNFNKAVEREASERADIPTAQLIEEYRATIGLRRHPPFTTGYDVLNDMVIHGQDIRRPLGIERAIPEQRLRACLDHIKGKGIPFGAKKRVAGLRLVATDLDWSHDEGPEVRGPGEALLLVLSGRRAGLDDLEGDGKETLAARMA